MKFEDDNDNEIDFKWFYLNKKNRVPIEYDIISQNIKIPTYNEYIDNDDYKTNEEIKNEIDKEINDNIENIKLKIQLKMKRSFNNKKSDDKLEYMIKLIGLYHQNKDNIEKTNFDESLYKYYKDIPKYYDDESFKLIPYEIEKDIEIKENEYVYYLEIKNKKLLYDNYCYIYEFNEDNESTERY